MTNSAGVTASPARTESARSYSYDSVSRLLSVLHQFGSTTLDGASYTYDNAGNRTSKTDLRTTTTSNYGYDAIYQLLQVTQGASTTETYSYDKVGNRLSSLGVSPYSYNSSNELTSTPTLTYTYDNNGNTKTKSDGTQYTWDYENRLTKVVLPGSGGTVNFKYDPFGRRVQKSFTQGSTTTTTNYLYDGPNLLEEVDNSGNVLARYTQGTAVDESLAMLRSGTASYYEQDGLGSVSSLSNTAGTLANTYAYDGYGRLTASTGKLTNPFQYTGREFDPETGIYEYRSRYYDAAVGRFLSEDSTGFAGGANFYSYVFNSPAGWNDPAGLSLSPAECAKLLQDIMRRLEILERKLGKYDPIEDGKGGHPYSAGGKTGVTIPGSHYAQIVGMQVNLAIDIARYKRDCGDGPGVPCRVWRTVNRKVPQPVIPRTLAEYRLDEEAASYDAEFWRDIAYGGSAVAVVLTGGLAGAFEGGTAGAGAAGLAPAGAIP